MVRLQSKYDEPSGPQKRADSSQVFDCQAPIPSHPILATVSERLSSSIQIRLLRDDCSLRQFEVRGLWYV